jgi:hypothetical protein
LVDGCWTDGKGRANLGSLLVAFVITFTVVSSVILGLGLAYGTIIAVLNGFARVSAVRPRLVLVPSGNQAGGD